MLADSKKAERTITRLRRLHPDLGPWRYDPTAGRWRGKGCWAQSVIGLHDRQSRLCIYFHDGRTPVWVQP